VDEHLREFPIDVALLPINGRVPERRVAGNVDGREAAQLSKEIGARAVIPCHYEMFTFNTADPAAFVEAAREIGQRCDALGCGERWERAVRSSVLERIENRHPECSKVANIPRDDGHPMNGGRSCNHDVRLQLARCSNHQPGP
jgi:hypothetical protein